MAPKTAAEWARELLNTVCPHSSHAGECASCLTTLFKTAAAETSASWAAALRPLLVEEPGRWGAFECQHGQPLTRACSATCPLNPLRKLIAGGKP